MAGAPEGEYPGEQVRATVHDPPTKTIPAPHAVVVRVAAFPTISASDVAHWHRAAAPLHAPPVARQVHDEGDPTTLIPPAHVVVTTHAAPGTRVAQVGGTVWVAPSALEMVSGGQ